MMIWELFELNTTTPLPAGKESGKALKISDPFLFRPE
jgi:hypothetical protein